MESRKTSLRPRVWIAAGILAACAMLSAAPMTAREAGSANVTPSFLVASPDLGDPLFQRSVILMLPRAQIPLVAGIIINKPTTIALGKLFPDAPALKNRADTAYFGGPVDPEAPSLLSRAPKPSAKAARLFDDIYLSSDPGPIEEFLKNPRPPKGARIFLGRAQWTEDQLHNEMLEGSWYTVPADAEMVFSPAPERIWRALVKRAQLLEVDAMPARAPEEFVLLRRAAW